MKAILLTILLSIVCFSAIAQKHRAEYVWGAESGLTFYKDKDAYGGRVYDSIRLRSYDLALYRTLIAIDIKKKDKWYSPSSTLGAFNLEVGLGYYSYQSLRLNNYGSGSNLPLSVEIETYRTLKYLARASYTHYIKKYSIKGSFYLAKNDLINFHTNGVPFHYYLRYGPRLQVGIPLFNE